MFYYAIIIININKYEPGRFAYLMDEPFTQDLWDYLACDGFDSMDRISGITFPTLVISATQDRMTPVKYGEYLHQRIPGAAFTLIEHAGHMMAIEKPDAVTAAVALFLGISPER